MMQQKIYLLLIPLLILGCGKSDQVNNPQISNGMLKINLASSSVFINDSLKLSARYISPTGENVSGSSINWRASNTSIAKVNPSGYLIGLQKGQTYIVASAPGFEEDSLLISIIDDSTAVASVLITGNKNNLSLKETLQLVAKAFNIEGKELINKSFSWESSASSIISVNSTGLVSALSSGTANITAKSENILSKPFEITVTGPERSGMFVKNPSQDHIISGTALLKENSDGTLTLQFSSDFAASSGPDVRVYLSTSTSISGNIFEVGALKSTSGMQTYSIPSDVSINSFDFVLIHCVPFNVTFGWAQLN